MPVAAIGRLGERNILPQIWLYEANDHYFAVARYAGLQVRIHLPPAASQVRTRRRAFRDPGDVRHAGRTFTRNWMRGAQRSSKR
jgi:hypothetical protein